MRRVMLCIVLTFITGAASGTSNAAEPTNTAPQQITGTVKDALGRALSNVSLNLQAADGRVVSHATTTAAGAFSFPSVAPGT